MISIKAKCSQKFPMMIKLFEVEVQIFICKCIKLYFHVQKVFSELFLCIFESTLQEGVRTLQSVNSSNQEKLQYVIYWHPARNVNCRPIKIYWCINRMQKLHQNIIFFHWNFFINTIIPFFHTANWHNCPSEHHRWKFYFFSLNGN